MNSNFRSFLGCALLAIVSLRPASSETITANFNGILPNTTIGTSYIENGILFSSPTAFNLAYGGLGGRFFGANPYQSMALNVYSNDWVSISTPGELMGGVSFTYGADWNHYLIAYGLMDTTFSWEASLDGTVIALGSQTWGRDNATTGGINLSVGQGLAFDTLKIRSTAVAYGGVYNPVAHSGGGGWYYERGEIYGFGDENHIAFDNVAVTRAAVPDAGSGAILLAIAGVFLLGMRRMLS